MPDFRIGFRRHAPRRAGRERYFEAADAVRRAVALELLAHEAIDEYRPGLADDVDGEIILECRFRQKQKFLLAQTVTAEIVDEKVV